MDLILRAVAAFFIVFLVTRVVGRRELSTMEPFDLILLVVMGDLVQQGVTQDDYSVTGLALVVVTIMFLTIAMAYLNYRVPRLRVVLEGEPVVLVENGRVIERNLRRERLTLDDLASEARQQQIASLGDVRFAVLETSGRISFIPDG